MAAVLIADMRAIAIRELGEDAADAMHDGLEPTVRNACYQIRKMTAVHIAALPNVAATMTRSRHRIFGRPSPSSSGGTLSISYFIINCNIRMS